eukprot:XP_024462549.1 succinate-semialdehyde dehydrogenase, mitochondrial isoform X3 [Populus trichocarpa]
MWSWGKAPDIGDASRASPEVRKITFAGSTAVGKKFMAGAAGTVKRLASKFRNRGQTCVCANRIIGQEGIFDKFADAFSKAVQRMLVGDGFSKGVAQLQTLINYFVYQTSHHYPYNNYLTLEVNVL